MFPCVMQCVMCPTGGVLWSLSRKQSGWWLLHVGSHEGGHAGVCHVMCQCVMQCVMCPTGGVLWSPGRQQSGWWLLHAGSHEGGHAGVWHVMCQCVMQCVSVSCNVSCVPQVEYCGPQADSSQGGGCYMLAAMKGDMLEFVM